MKHIKTYKLYESERFSAFELTKKLKDKIKSVGHALNQEVKETFQACEIFIKLITGKYPTTEEVKFLKEQSIDIIKILSILGLQAVPGSSVAIIALEKAGKKYGFTVFPKQQNFK